MYTKNIIVVERKGKNALVADSIPKRIYTTAFLLEFKNKVASSSIPEELLQFDHMISPTASLVYKSRRVDSSTNTNISKVQRKQMSLDERTKGINQINSNLCKIAPQNQEKITTNIMTILNDMDVEEKNLLGASLLTVVISEVMDRGITCLKHSQMYVGVLHSIFVKYGDCVRIMISKLSESEFVVIKPLASISDDIIAKKQFRKKGVMKFLPELMKAKLLLPKIILKCLEMLPFINNFRVFDIDNISNFCDLLSLTYPNVSSENLRVQFRVAFGKLENLLKKEAAAIGSRLCFKINDTLLIRDSSK